MILRLTERFQERVQAVGDALVASKPRTYKEILEVTLRALDDEWGFLDPDRIVEADWGDYQGTKVFLVGGAGSSPAAHYVTYVSYGSCSYCDLLDGIYSDVPHDEDCNRVYGDQFRNDLLRLALHMIQRMKEV